MATKEEIATDVLTEIAADSDKQLKVSGRRKPEHWEHRHRGFFIWRRAVQLQDLDPNWSQPARRAALKNKIRGEYALLKAFTSQAVSARPASPAAGNPPDLDLADVARVLVTDAAGKPTVERRLKRYRRQRRHHITAICWRAGALNAVAWQGSPSSDTSTLSTPDLEEMLNRRLRSVEWFTLTISKRNTLFGRTTSLRDWTFAPNSPNGPWYDRFRIRNFEYPRIPSYLRATGIEVGAGKPWDTLGSSLLAYQVLTAPRGPTKEDAWRFPDFVARSWLQSAAGGYRIDLSPEPGGDSAAQIVDGMFDYKLTVPPLPPPDAKAQTKQNFWQRSWLWCDLVMAAVHLESLLFGLRRRHLADTPDGTARFNAVVARTNTQVTPPAPYAGLAALVVDGPVDDPTSPTGLEGANDGYLMSEGTNGRHFENTGLKVLDDLQVGDHVVFFNNGMYRYLEEGDWGLENCLVNDLDSDPFGTATTANQRRRLAFLGSLRLIGHGMRPGTYGSYQKALLKELRAGVNELRTAVKANRTQTEFRHRLGRGVEVRLIKWSPYEEFAEADFFLEPEFNRRPGARERIADLGAWFVIVKVDRTQLASEEMILGTYPLAVEAPGVVAAGFKFPRNDPSFFDRRVLFPLFEPAIALNAGEYPDDGLGRSTWNAYFERRRTRSVAVPRLRPVRLSRAMVPGLFARGEKKPFGVVRPFPRE